MELKELVKLPDVTNVASLMAWQNFLSSLNKPPSDPINPDQQDDIAQRYTNNPEGVLPQPPPTKGEHWQAWALAGGSFALLALCFDTRPMEALLAGAILGGAAAYMIPLRTLKWGPYLLGFSLAFALGRQLHFGDLFCWVIGALGAIALPRLYYEKANDLTIDSLWK
jgi:hypothetical protein